MSRLLADRFTAVLCPDRVALVRRRRGWRSPPAVLAEEPCASAAPLGAIAALTGLLARQDAGPGELTVVLSNHFVRYILVPWSDAVNKPPELAAFASVCLDGVFGPEPAGRVLLTSRERAGGARVAAALEAPLLGELRAMGAGSRLRLVSVQPYLAAVFNCGLGSLPRRDFIFVVAEPTRSCVLLARNGRWSSLRNTAASDSPRDIANLVEREAQLSGLAEEGMPPVFVHAPGRHDLQVPPCHGVLPQSVSLGRGPSQACNPLLAMALAVA